MASKPRIDEGRLTKDELRKLNALRKSVGDEIAANAFRTWLQTRPAPTSAAPADKMAEVIASAVEGLISSSQIKSVPRGGYIVERGRGRVIVQRST